MELKFRRLEASEVECRVASIGNGWVSLLLYKDARVDQNILDETVGAMNWQKSYCRDNANCIVSIWDDDKKMWISKEDTGKESNTEAEKGLASDSFKRACFNWGIGRELYTAPTIFVNCETEKNEKGKWICKESFKVLSIGYDAKGNIASLVIVYEKSNKVAFSFPKGESKAKPKAEPKAQKNELSLMDKIQEEMKRTGISTKTILYNYRVNSLDELTEQQMNHALEMFSKTPTRAK